MATIKEVLNKSHLANVKSSNNYQKDMPLEAIDELADELVKQFDNPIWRPWYCGVVRKFGPAKVQEWRRRASEGREPGKLFTVYVNQAGGYKKAKK